MSLAANQSARHQFGTAPVFLTAISSILGAVMFRRFDYAVAAGDRPPSGQILTAR